MSKETLKDENLENVTGGAETTSYGYPIDNFGNVTFTDKTGASVVLTGAQWESLKSHYTFTGGNPEAYLKDVTIKEMKQAMLIP